MFQEYFELYNTYTQKYGPKTAIFLMVGAFYELYEFQHVETGETRSNVKEIVDILGIQVSIKKEVEPGYNGLVAGFPDYVMHKWAGRLTSTGWTVVIVDQIKERGKVKERKVSRILSPSTHIENITSTDTPYIVTLYFIQTDVIRFGAAILDLTTGTTSTYSGTANGNSDVWTADDIVQLLCVFQPKELLIYWDGITPDVSTFRRIFGIQQIPIHIRTAERNAFSKELVRSEYLQKIYSMKSILPIRTYLGLKTDMDEFALLFLLQFVEEHYSALQFFNRNEPWIPEERLICGNHALTQLQMTGTNQHETVIGLFDKSITSMGKRAIRDRLVRPYSNSEEIKLRLREVQEYMIWTDKTKRLEKQLRFICDMPRLHRKIQCGIITSQEIVALFQSYQAIQEIMKITKNTSLEEEFGQEEWLHYTTVFHSNFNYDKALTASNDISAFSEKYKDICEKEKEIKETIDGFHSLRREIAINGKVQEDTIRLEEREKEPYGLKCSTVTLAQLKKNIKDIKVSELKSGGWIDCITLQQLNTKLQRLRESLHSLIKLHIMDACVEISEANIWSKIEKWICHVDCTQCIGRVSKERGYCCPKIESGDSSVDIKSIRHPLVEASSTRISYVKHDINLKKGWLVYGMNASGKSTLMKATGICILLAQAGCFVPAKEMTLVPFRSIYTRILNQDNIFAGLSSFAVEMSELRDILRNANEHTLVLGDELCAGTESISAQALVASGIQWLCKKNAKFIFATHLHDIPNIIDTKDVEVWHLHVEYDPITKKLVYDRTLRPGNGSTLYGLEVARAMDLPFEFIEQALKNRRNIIGSTTQIDAVTSSWNKEIVKNKCEICHNEITDKLEVHHIKPRADATNRILEDGTHMNDKRNLIVICQTCHDDTHAGVIEIGEIKITSDGPERDIIVRERTKKSKWSNEENIIIMNTLDKYSSLSLKAIRKHLDAICNITISEAMLGKIRSGKN